MVKVSINGLRRYIMKLTELEELGLKNVGNVYHNLSYDELIKHELANGEVVQTNKGATAVDTGIFTGC